MATKPNRTASHALLGTDVLATGDLMLAEVLQGFKSDNDFRNAKGVLTSMEVIELGNAGIAIQAAKHFRQLRAKRITVRKTIDTIIATRCIVDGYALPYSDRNFDPFVDHLGLRPALRI